MKTILTKKLKQKWIKALRSGKYKQGDASLHEISGNTYCCLGVLQEIDNIICVGNSYLEGDNARSCVRGLTMQKQERLADMNDGGFTFAEISDWIEKKVNPKL